MTSNNREQEIKEITRQLLGTEEDSISTEVGRIRQFVTGQLGGGPFPWACLHQLRAVSPVRLHTSRAQQQITRNKERGEHEDIVSMNDAVG